MRKFFKLFFLQIRYDWIAGTAYMSKNIMLLTATLTYTLFFYVFYEVIYGKVGTVAGYNRNEALFLMFNGQFAYYTAYVFVIPGLKKMNLILANGQLDYILLRPYSSLQLVSLLKIELINYINLASAPLLFMAMLINWKQLDIDLYSLLLGYLIMIIGLYIYHCIGFIAMCLVILDPSMRKITKPLEAFFDVGRIPFEGYGNASQFFLTTILPIAFIAIIPTGVMLNKLDVGFLYKAVMVSVVFGFLKKTIWYKSLKYYSSAGG